ncbi:cytochrome c maturation protein CcmE [Candidatus Paracaedibacter symbiosus]|uniref:cytochrome c maturation protein CcmE n=1 Tax=Candidatus Paracaedibacter symbiosus TaxID=244582 RepID=UPI000509ECEF|nr:cytochrome c maturation protein CcmE [Candidatus Paracaedibacter symbiosus]
MTQKQRHRVWYLVICLLGIVGVGIIVAVAFQESMMYFVTPSELLSNPDHTRQIRLGGLVEKNSVTKEPRTLTTTFVVTDNVQAVPVSYVGIVPDLFREEQGVIVEGKLQPNGNFKADRLLAKHDENYMPPEIAGKIEKVK